MKILLTGGGTGGHFYPLIAIAEALNKIADEEKFLNFKLYYAADKPYDKHLLDEQFITFIPVTAGKLRVYFSLRNFFDLFKTGFGVLRALWKVFRLYPDVIISKGGYAAFPVLFAARILRIPVIIHESDTVPGRVNLWSGTWARKVAVSFSEAAEYFPKETVSYTGQPLGRRNIAHPSAQEARQFFDLDPTLPTIGIWGGSQGAHAINDVILNILPTLLDNYQVIHQTGASDYEEVTTQVHIALGENIKRNHYKPFAYLNDVQTKMFGGAVDLIISRSGSSLFEIALWGKPSILIPYPIAHGDHQKKNAYHYARTGACVVIEEGNLTDSVLANEIEDLLGNRDRYTVMANHAKQFFKPDAARIIATEAVKIALSHQK